MNRTCSVLVAIAALGGAAASPSFSEIDKDNDGFISATESLAVPGLSEQMTVLDTNSDGLLSPAEFAHTKIPPVQESIPMEPDTTTEPTPEPFSTNCCVGDEAVQMA